MIFLLEIGQLPTLESMAFSVPESVGLLVFGVGLAAVAILLRSLLAKAEKAKSDKRVETEA